MNPIGQTFDRLTVLEEIVDEKGARKFRCRCQCNKVVTVSKYSVLYGHTRSCGCYRRHRRENLVGQRFGYLVILELTQEKDQNGNYRVRCQCDCGRETKPYIHCVVGGTTTSCGCRRDQYEKLIGKNSSQFTGYEGIGGSLWGRIRRSARKRHLDFDIELPYAWALLVQQQERCVLTNLPIRACGPHPTASLDRIDSTKGYVCGNIQWVHKVVNIMRNIYTMDQFFKVCFLVAHKQGWNPPDHQMPPPLSW